MSADGTGQGLVELTVGPRLRPLEGLVVNRIWPTARRRLIGPFVFFDHLQPVELAPGEGLDVPPHPHIGLATVTYLFSGELLHRDSLGCEQIIRPGELNWMSAGAGIVHSERTTPAARQRHSSLHGIQTWVALPAGEETAPPSFSHYPRAALPLVEEGGFRACVLAGEAFGARSEVATASPLFYAEVELEPGARLPLPPALGQRAAYAVTGTLAVEGMRYEPGRLLVFRDGPEVSIEAAGPARLIVFGGEPLEGERHVWWNFVSSSPERIEAAKRDWREQRFPSVPGDAGYMPLPG